MGAEERQGEKSGQEKFMEEGIAELSLGRQMGIILSKSRLWREGKDIQVDK